MRLLFNIVWWILVIIGFLSLGYNKEFTTFATYQEALNFSQTTETAGSPLQQDDGTYKVSTVDPDAELSFIQGIALFAFVIQIIKSILGFLGALLSEDNKEEAVLIIFIW
jgi:hypothetical protein